jgi:hypothetical protein
MASYAWVLEVRPGYEELYKLRHDAIWPEMLPWASFFSPFGAGPVGPKTDSTHVQAFAKCPNCRALRATGTTLNT